VQASSNENNGLQQHCDMSQWRQFFFLTSFPLFLLHHFFFSSYKFFQAHTQFFSWLLIFFLIIHDPISIVMNVDYSLVAHDFFLGSSPSCFSNHLIDFHL
jgi:hypothetical protein